MWQGKKVSVVLPAYNEKENIYKAIQDFFSCEEVDEVVVVNNNSNDGTEEEVAWTKSVLINEENQGYGFAKHQYPLLPILCILSADYISGLGLKISRQKITILAAKGFTR